MANPVGFAGAATTSAAAEGLSRRTRCANVDAERVIVIFVLITIPGYRRVKAAEVTVERADVVTASDAACVRRFLEGDAASVRPIDVWIGQVRHHPAIGRLDQGPLPLAEVLRYGTEIASALDGAHRRGIVHRDLKPANIMLTKGGAKLMDFGLARPAALAPGVAALT